MPPRPGSDVPQRRRRPVLADDRRTRAHESALWVSALAVVIAPAWSGFDLLLEPQLARTFLVVRLTGVVPMLAVLWVLWRRPLGRRLRPVPAAGEAGLADSPAGSR